MTHPVARLVTLSFVLLAAVTAVADDSRLAFEKTDGGIAIRIDGKPFTQYHERFQNKPILHPIVGPSGKEMTRPLDSDGDHVHHASLWFTHGNVNGLDFWHKKGLIEHQEYLTVGEKGSPTLKTRSIWKDDKDIPIGEELRVMEFGADDATRWIDVDITFTATAPVTFGKTKEGAFGVRIWPSLTVKNGGTIHNSAGQKNDKAWSQPAAWVDYFGDIDGETVGIAVLNHPSSFRHPTPWHVRTYGLFAANPFMREALKLDSGQTLHLRHRVVLHRGTTAEAGIQAIYDRYAKTAAAE